MERPSIVPPVRHKGQPRPRRQPYSQSASGLLLLLCLLRIHVEDAALGAPWRKVERDNCP